MLLQDRGRSPSAAFHTIHHDHVRARLSRKLDVIEHPARAHFDEDWNPPAGGFPELLDLKDHIVRAQKVGVARRAALVHSDWQIPLARDLIGNLRAEQKAAGSGLCALADRQLDGVRLQHVMNIDAVARGQDLVNQRAAVLALGG